MSKKSARKKTSVLSPDAGIIGHLLTIKENFENPAGCDNAVLASQTAKILDLVKSRGSERKALIHKSSGGIEIILKSLHITDDSQITYTILSILNILAKNKYCGQLFKEGVIPAVLSSLLATSRSTRTSDPLLLLHLSILCKLAVKDKKFCIKARLSGMLPVSIGLLKRCQEDQSQLVTILFMLKVLSSSSTNCEALGKLNCLNILLKLISKVGQKDLIVLKHCINVLAQLLKQKSVSNRLIAQSCVKQLVSLHEQLHQIDRHHRHIQLRKAILTCLKVSVGRDPNLQSFYSADGLRILYTTARDISISGCKELRPIANLTCLVLKNCLPSIPLPIDSRENPIKFSLPKRCFHHISISQSSSARTTSSDLTSNPPGILEGKPAEGENVPDCTESVETAHVLCPKIEDEIDSEELSYMQFDSSNLSVECFRGISNILDFFREVQLTYDMQQPLSATIDTATTSEETSSFHVLNELKQSPHQSPHDSASDSDDLELQSIIVPTAALCCNDEITISSEQHELVSLIPFTLKSHPQTIGHVPSQVSEAIYSKRASVDRRLYLADVERYITADTLINRTVFDFAVDHDQGNIANSSSTVPILEGSGEEENLKSCQNDISHFCNGTNNHCQFIEQGNSIHSHLCFESSFESANLRKAIQVREYEYDLLLNSDINTNHHHQWFYFKVINMEASVPYRFNIINCEKPNSQFNFGMQPLLYSTIQARVSSNCWVRTGTDILYYCNNYYDGSGSSGSTCKRKFYTLSFTVIFQHSNDICYFAYHYPYTYSMLQSDLRLVQVSAQQSSTNIYYCCQSLCTTLCGNACPLITITDASEVPSRYIFLSARVHPGETNSSWIMKGIINYLVSDHPNAQALRKMFVFKIVPMLNPDGVIHGSHRCSLSGEDLNRQWINPDPFLHPTIYYTKSLLKWLVKNDKTPYVYCDFHGHSRRKNIFMYGCKSINGSRDEEVLPQILDSIAPIFSYRSCSFSVEKSKEATARVVVWKEFGVTRSYTMESTYCGADQGPTKGYQLGTSDLEYMGLLFCESLQTLFEQPASVLHPEVVQSNSELTSSESSVDTEFEGSLSENNSGLGTEST